MSNKESVPVKIMPNAWWYLVGLVIFLLGGCATSAIVGAGLVDEIKHMERSAVPGTITLDLDVGGYVIFNESASQIDGKAYLGDKAIANLRCSVESADSENVVEVLPVRKGEGLTYNLPPYAGKSVFAFDIGKSGLYEVECTKEDRAGVIAIGREGQIGRFVKKAVAIGLGSAFSGLGMMLIILIGRVRAAG